jgi:predicted negative regulator of RcsB-dependent stress response
LSLLYHLEVLSEQDLLPQQNSLFSVISSLTQSGEIFFPEKNSISQINQAEEFFNLGLYEDALLHYIGALENGNDNPYLKLRIAQIHLLFGKHTEALAVLNLLDNLSYEIENLVLIMRAHAERCLGNYKLSIDILKPFALAEGVNTTSKMPYFEQAQLELALNYLALDDETSATKHLISILHQKKQAELFCFAQLQLAQIAFKKDALNEVEKILSQ